MKKSILLLGLIGPSSFGLKANEQGQVAWTIVKAATWNIAKFNCIGEAAFSAVCIPKNYYYSIPVKEQIIYLGVYSGLAYICAKKYEQEKNNLQEDFRVVVDGLTLIGGVLELSYYGYGAVRSYFS